MNDQAPGKLSKFQRYRARKRAQGLREVRMWVRDPDDPRVRAEIEAFCAFQRDSAEERAIMEFIQGHMEDVMKDHPY